LEEKRTEVSNIWRKSEYKAQRRRSKGKWLWEQLRIRKKKIVTKS
jgi:hypothetical protein